MVIQRTEWEGRPLLVTWLDPPFYPPRHLTTQAYGLCFVPNGQVVLVSAGGGYWNLPGGRPEGAAVGPVAGLTVCDVACGQGVVTRELARRGASATGVDLSARLIELARRYEEQEPLGIAYRLLAAGFHPRSIAEPTLPPGAYSDPFAQGHVEIPPVLLVDATTE